MDNQTPGNQITVELVYALADRAFRKQFKLPEGSQIKDALAQSRLYQQFPETADYKFGIYGKLCKADALLRDHDRIEIYRPLIADPKEVRKQRSLAGKQMKKGAAQLEERP